MGKANAKVSGWMGAAMWVEGDSLVIRRPPSGKTTVPLEMDEGFTHTNAAIGQKGFRVVVRGGSLQNSRVTNVATVSDDPYLIPLKPGKKNAAECAAFGQQVMAMKGHQQASAHPPPPPPPVEDVSADRLRELAALRDEGVITDEDFETAKQRFLAR